MDPTVALGLAGVIGGIITAAITKVFDYLSARGDSQRKAQAETLAAKSLEDQITDRVLARADAELAKANARIDAQQDQIDELIGELQVYRLWSSMLCNQVVALGKEPVPMPERKKV